ERFLLTPVVTDPEDDPYTLSWSGDIPTTAIINGVFDWTPTTADVGNSYIITVTATQDDNPSLTDSETFVLSVVAGAATNADVSVTIAPVTAGNAKVGDAVSYVATVYNAGPAPVSPELAVALEFRANDQATWGTPAVGIINGVFFAELDELASGASVEVTFEANYHAFGTQELTAGVAGAHEDAEPDNDTARLTQ